MEQTPEDMSLTEDARLSRRAIDAPCENLASPLQF